MYNVHTYVYIDFPHREVMNGRSTFPANVVALFYFIHFYVPVDHHHNKTYVRMLRAVITINNDILYEIV